MSRWNPDGVVCHKMTYDAGLNVFHYEKLRLSHVVPLDGQYIGYATESTVPTVCPDKLRVTRDSSSWIAEIGLRIEYERIEDFLRTAILLSIANSEEFASYLYDSALGAAIE